MKNKHEEHLKITVIIPVYNVALYLRRCLDSVLQQTYPYLEIIVVDDGSTDGCGAICDEYACQDQRVIVIHQDNQGLSAARNAALEIMSGELVGFVDSDDWLDTDFYETMVQKMMETQADIVVMGYKIVYQKESIPYKGYVGSWHYQTFEALKALECAGLGHIVWNKLYKRELWQHVRFPNGRVFEDVLTTWQTFIQARLIVSMDGYKYHHIIRKSSICATLSLRPQAFLAHADLYEKLQDYEQKSLIPIGSSEPFLKATVMAAYMLLYHCSYQDIKPFEFQKAQTFWKQHRQQLATLGTSYWLIAHFPRLGSIYLRCRRTVQRMGQIFLGYHCPFQ